MCNAQVTGRRRVYQWLMQNLSFLSHLAQQTCVAERGLTQQQEHPPNLVYWHAFTSKYCSKPQDVLLLIRAQS